MSTFSNRATGGFVNPDAGTYRGSDPHAAKAFQQLQQQLRQARPDPVMVVVGHATDSGHYLLRELVGKTFNDGASGQQADYGMMRGSVLLGINTFEQSTGTHWIDVGTSVVGSRRLNATTNRLGEDTHFFSVPVNYAGTNLTNGGTGGMTNTGGTGSGTSGTTGFGTDPGGNSGSRNNGGETDPGGGGGGSSDTGGGSDGSCPLVETVTIGGGTAADGSYPCVWDGAAWVYSGETDDGSTSQEVIVNGSPGSWFVQYSAMNDGGSVLWDWTSDSEDACPHHGEYDGGPGDGITATVG